MRIHATRITGSLSVSGSGGVDFTNATAGVSGSFRPSDVKVALPAGTVSGSAQTSATLPENTVSSSAQIAVDISGSFTSASSSLASRITTNKSNMTLATASVATNESNMTLATASIAAITASVSTLKSNVGQALNTDSAVTFATVDTGQGANELYDMDQNVLTTSSPTFAAATITGTLTATEVHTQYVSSSITVSSGSNTFGDEITDLHSFTGSLSVSGSGAITAHGNVSSSTSSTGSFGRVEGRTDFTTIDVDDDEIPIAKLASDNVSYGGISVTLGASDATPAFDLSDATAYTGDSSLVTTGTVTSGVWNSSFGATAATQITGSFAAVSSSLETKKASKGFTIAMSVAL